MLNLHTQIVMENTIEDRKVFKELAILLLNSQMKNRTRVTSADLVCHLTQLTVAQCKAFLEEAPI